jgi:hypothetical protein
MSPAVRACRGGQPRWRVSLSGVARRLVLRLFYACFITKRGVASGFASEKPVELAAPPAGEGAQARGVDQHGDVPGDIPGRRLERYISGGWRRVAGENGMRDYSCSESVTVATAGARTRRKE